MGHLNAWGSSMPVFDSRRRPDHIAGIDVLPNAALLLHPAGDGGDNQCLPGRMSAPYTAGTRGEGELGATAAGAAGARGQGFSQNGIRGLL
ncbi:hypothetical protein B1T48_23880 [Mycobacterium persicum]|nr:hypothetical protein B1T48_23880 [Mycobacterium persicum]